MAMQQETIYWRYVPYILGLVEGLNFKEYPHNSYGQAYGPVRLRTSILGSCNVAPPQWCLLVYKPQ